jgi:hypothetical protein
MSDDAIIEPPAPATIESSASTEEGVSEAFDVSNVVHLVPRAHEDKWPEATEFLKQLVAMSERGELAQIGIVFERVDTVSSFRAIFRPGSRPARLLGELEVMRTAIAIHLCPRPTTEVKP